MGDGLVLKFYQSSYCSIIKRRRIHGCRHWGITVFFDSDVLLLLHRRWIYLFKFL